MTPVTHEFEPDVLTKAYISLSHWGLQQVDGPVVYAVDYEKNCIGPILAKTLNGVTYAIHYN